MNQVITTVAKIAQTGVRNDDDIVDRLNHRYTSLLLVIFTIVISTTQYVGTPIHCWCPAFFSSNHEKYANNFCWISDTYYLTDENAMPGVGVRRKHIGYYQWIPVALLVQALLFFMPCLFWRILSDRSGINVNNLVEAAETIQNALYPERREKTIRYMIRHLDHYLDYQRDYRSVDYSFFRLWQQVGRNISTGMVRGNYLVGLYLTTKLIYIINSIGQIYLLNLFLGADYHMYGIQIIIDLMKYRESRLQRQNRFPRSTLCDFKIFQMGNVQPHTVQCVLPINFFNEKIYLFLWFWIVFVSLATFLSLFRWVFVLAIGQSRTRYVRKHLKIMDRVRSDNDRDRKLSYKFAEKYLRQDGVFVLKLVAKNSTDLVVADIVAALWDHFKTKPRDLPAHQRPRTRRHPPQYLQEAERSMGFEAAAVESYTNNARDDQLSLEDS
ncbi:hypothetical protein HELRODRAFT_95018 [Helobdella robusta]|uniref:Innexin n=1 Tax=Helobdella robusta TaxID=6412 RepID=T1G942_HELRO|nr:hypothetical protein HELRODRAFT_95018 [Helobdella robusta]ESN98968.1 hypothetical protein HELRODRAFT_95018 [Helobdella robusta]